MPPTKKKLSKKQIVDRASELFETHFAKLPKVEGEKKRKEFEDFVNQRECF